MAIKTFYSQGLKVKYFTGEYDENDKEIVKSKTYSNVKSDVTPAGAFEVAQALVGLTKGTFDKAFLVRVDEISE